MRLDEGIRPSRQCGTTRGEIPLSWEAIDAFAGNFTSPVLTAARPCPICGALSTRLVAELGDFQFYTDSALLPKRATIRTVQCAGCFALYQNPGYSTLGFGVLFAEAGRSYGATAGRAGEETAWLAARGLLATGARVLDVGCHEGEFLAALPAHVARVGFDVDAAAVERGRRRFHALGVELVCGDPETFAVPAAPDTITMFHVLEHLPRPVGVLARLRALAHASTRLVVEVPILENGATADVNGFFSVQHVTHFSRGSLRNALALSGWRVVEWHEQADYNGCRIVAAPCPEDVAALQDHLAWRHAALADLERALTPVRDAPRLALWGAGTHLEMLYHLTSLFQATTSRTYVLVDGDETKQFHTWRGLEIHPPTTLARPDLAGVPVVISSYGSQEEIAEAAVALGTRATDVVRLYRQVRVY
jgi:SAM-dependent methyltransferase